MSYPNGIPAMIAYKKVIAQAVSVRKFYVKKSFYSILIFVLNSSSKSFMISNSAPHQKTNEINKNNNHILG